GVAAYICLPKTAWPPTFYVMIYQSSEMFHIKGRIHLHYSFCVTYAYPKRFTLLLYFYIKAHITLQSITGRGHEHE
ncbi:hypothetical protein PTB13_09640, partial [Bacillus sp. MHSD17]|nr:hypothetical protein [Bacillus sp. MHSD17]